MTTASDFTERESAIIERLTERFSGHSLNADIVVINKLEGGNEPTVRFTLDDVSSTDFSRVRIASQAEAVEDLASEAADELEHPGEPIGT
jgi:hypothetical protein